MVIRRYVGDTYPIICTLKDDCTAVDLTGGTVKLTIDYDTPVTITGTLTDAANGIVQFDLQVADVSEVGFFSYDIQFTDPSGIVTTYEKDIIDFIDDVTP